MSQVNNSPLLRSGKAKITSKNYLEAISYFSKIIKNDAGNREAFFYRAQASFYLHDWKKAIFDSNYAIKLGKYQNLNDRELSHYFQFRAKVKYSVKDFIGEAKDYEIAIKLLERGRRYNPATLSILYAGLANGYFELNEVQRTIKAANKAIEINPYNGNAYFIRGNAYQFFKTKTDIKLACNDWKKARTYKVSQANRLLEIYCK